jgi:site-specific recombinase XerD
MLERLFTDPKAVPRLRSSPLGPWLDSFIGRLADLGYTESSCRSNVVLAADLGRWMAANGHPVGTLGESTLEAYVTHRGTKRQRQRRHAAADHLLAHLRAEGVAPPPPEAPDRRPGAAYGQRYAAYMRKERGAAEGTVQHYVAVVHDFFGRRFGSGHVDLAALTTSDVAGYLLQRAPALSPKSVANLASALRSFFRFLFVQGETATDLSTAPLMSQTKHGAAVPRYLSPAEVDRMIDTCDRSTPAGRRNRAILVLLARLGLRAGEVGALELDDIRWRSAEIVVRGKGNQVDRLPLLPEVGEALSSYLTNDRAAHVSTRRVFLRLCAPVREVAGQAAISTVVRRSLARAGLRPQVRGAHLLRHTLGTQMIRAGASMTEIAEVLRHRLPRSSAIYAKVDFEALRTLAQPWPAAGAAR